MNKTDHSVPYLLTYILLVEASGLFHLPKWECQLYSLFFSPRVCVQCTTVGSSGRVPSLQPPLGPAWVSADAVCTCTCTENYTVVSSMVHVYMCKAIWEGGRESAIS